MNFPSRTQPAKTNNKQYQQVQLALRPRAMSIYLKKALSPLCVCEAESKLAPCHILDMKYEPEQYCSILYQLEEQMVVGAFRWDEPNHPTESLTLDATPGSLLAGLQVYRPRQDPALSSLPIALDPKAMVPILNAALPMCRRGAARVLRCRVSPVRYRPGKRCTLRFEVWLRDTKTDAFISQTLFGKIYHKLDKARSVYEEMQMLAEIAATRDGALGLPLAIVLAKAVVFLPDLKMILQEPVKGTPLDALLGFGAKPPHRMEGDITTGDSRGWRGVQQAAIALAALHQTRVTSKRQRPIVKELARFKHRAAKAATVDVTVGTRLGELAAALPAWLEHLADWGAEVGLVHGDCKPSQFLIDKEQTALLDFDHCGMADQASDVGAFMAKLRQLRVQQSLKAPHPPNEECRGDNGVSAVAGAAWLYALEQRFLDEYCIASEQDSEFRLRVTWYEAVALLRKALRSFARSPRSVLPAALVGQAWRCLTELPSPTRVISYEEEEK